MQFGLITQRRNAKRIVQICAENSKENFVLLPNHTDPRVPTTTQRKGIKVAVSRKTRKTIMLLVKSILGFNKVFVNFLKDIF